VGFTVRAVEAFKGSARGGLLSLHVALRDTDLTLAIWLQN